MIGQHILIRSTGDREFKKGVLELAISDEGKLLVGANSGFQVFFIEDALDKTSLKEQE